MKQLLLVKTTPPLQLLPIPKVDLSLLRIHEAPPLQEAKSQVINGSKWSTSGMQLQLYPTRKSIRVVPRIFQGSMDCHSAQYLYLYVS